MLGLALLFLIIAIVAYALGAGSAGDLSLTIAKWCAIIFVILLVLSIALGIGGNPYWGYPIYRPAPVVVVP